MRCTLGKLLKVGQLYTTRLISSRDPDRSCMSLIFDILDARELNLNVGNIDQSEIDVRKLSLPRKINLKFGIIL